MLLNIAYFSYSLSDELKIYLEKTENIGAIQMFSPIGLLVVFLIVERVCY